MAKTESSKTPEMTDGERHAAGMAVRTQVFGEDYIGNVDSGVTELTEEFHDMVTRYAWGEVWSRPGLDRRTRSAVVLSSLIAQGQTHELGPHIRGAVRNGLTKEEVVEVVIHTAIYSGVPKALSAFRVVNEVFGAK